MPPATEISDGADLARIKYYRNQIVHAEKDEIAKQDFTIAWACDEHINELSSEFTKQIQDLPTEIKDRAEDTIPVNIRSQNDQYINEWMKDDSEFIVTRAAKHVAASIQLHNCIVVTGSSGTGKSSIIHHIALNLFKHEGYEIISLVTGPFRYNTLS
ncbi:unnamed protein product [Mytilus edulis]|uniref:DZIP3-like HEPN domain-containing protein n=1 Tax=Mytilus edulis TaxID=6550 RepID=A0A8S3TGJ1_MYTED|nr:unnamed protein product [Mytilus edulis]